jgi:hypothetical protein
MQMTYLAAAVAALSLIVVSPAHADDLPSRSQLSAPNIADVGTVSPALERYTRDTLFDGLWHRPALSPRDRSIVTLDSRKAARRFSSPIWTASVRRRKPHEL